MHCYSLCSDLFGYSNHLCAWICLPKGVVMTSIKFNLLSHPFFGFGFGFGFSFSFGFVFASVFVILFLVYLGLDLVSYIFYFIYIYFISHLLDNGTLLVVRTYAIEVGNLVSNWAGYKVFIHCEKEGMVNLKNLNWDDDVA
jgi:hypothetical protein